SSALDRGWYRCKICLYDFQKSCSTARIPPHSEGALRAIVTTRGAGSDGRGFAAACPWDARTNGEAADVKSQRADTPMLVSSAMCESALSPWWPTRRRTRQTAYKR
ncbi:MAG: hypothetical protein E6531_06785, partial [Bradyrhizobium sp.]|nr:hypothetical protein [Bradyrhizobium sp.]